MNIRRLTFIWAMLFAVSGAFAQEIHPHHINELTRPLILEFQNTGGYTAWFRVSWTEGEESKDQYENKKYTSDNIATGSSYILEVPQTANLNTLHIEGFTNTGILWDKYRQIFDITFDSGIDVYTYMSHDYYAIKTWGTTFYPYWAPVVPTMGVEGFMFLVDPYADEVGKCTRFTTRPGEYTLNNFCIRWAAIFHLTGLSGRQSVRLAPTSKTTVYGVYDTFWAEQAD